ncbi:MAG TPA: glycosyltransferase [Arenicellales bacterium]|nr:glycosyltransferase [Arenicellales bacterium]
MSRADLHLHSRYSISSSEYLVRMLQLNESYTGVEALYRQAKARGMDFVTITDHDTIDGALELVERHPDDTFVSVEVTARFPEDQCKAHILVYGIDEARFDHVQKIRHDIYELRDYLVTEALAHSLAHATYDMDGLLNVSHLQKFILLFDVFEGCNGGRDRRQNEGWNRLLQRLTPEKIEELYHLHRIEPVGREPWIKGFTGGSDDHAGLFIGSAWTRSAATSIDGFLESIRDRRTGHGGDHGNFRKMALSFYKILYDHSRSGRDQSASTGAGIRIFNSVLFDGRGPGLRDRIRLKRARRHLDFGTRNLAGLLADVSSHFGGTGERLIEPDDVEWLYGRLSRYLDKYFSHLLTECAGAGDAAHSFGALRRILSFLPVPLLSMPFLATSRLIFATGGLVNSAGEALYGPQDPRDGTVLWFTDTITDLNGVTETLKLFCSGAEQMELDLCLAVCVPGDAPPPGLPRNVLHLAAVHSFSSTVYSSYTVHFPSLLESLKRVSERSPREILVSTPGPMGFLGLVAARVLGIPCRSIYHTDFKVQLELIAGRGMAPALVDQFCRAFYAATDEIQVPSRVYLDTLSQRGYPAERLSLFTRGLDDAAFGFHPEQRFAVMARHDIPVDRFTLLWAGRVSHDKNIDFLLERFRELRGHDDGIQLVLAGDGPALEHYREVSRDPGGVHWLGRLDRAQLRQWYSAADLFVFPSVMDTFGMAVLEAQAAGLPAIVSDIGGPQEIVDNGRTGYILSLAEPRAWTQHICTLMNARRASAANWNEKRHEIAQRTAEHSSLRTALEKLLRIELPKAGGTDVNAAAPAHSRQVA